MRLVKLSVQRFQCIESAEVEFGPGLNVLYGPNDIGKSSLAWAIRAVLLLQHDSTQHKRFVSWHGEGEPRVALTFVDAQNRYWRVTKTFGGSTGRSSLETSKDGRVYTGESNGRQVDEKLRKMLGWGVNAPGGKSTVRGIPDAFLIQVLLAEQDNVRKVLFESSLGDDPDESGRARLTEALGAMAQDPLFKKILDKAQAHSDKAFTATGRKKKTANSPFIELDTRIKNLTDEHEELETKIRETASAEARIRQLLAQRDDLDLELKTGRDTLSTTETRFAAQALREGLLQQVTDHEDVIRGAEELSESIETAQQALAELQKKAEAQSLGARDAMSLASQADLARDEARSRMDALALDTVADRRRAELEESQRVANEALHTAQREVERAGATLKQAREISIAFKHAIASSITATDHATSAEQLRSVASDDAKRARQAVSDAEQLLRDATSDDKARAKELRRAELENRRLTRQSERTGHASTLQRIAEVRDALAKADAAEAAHAAMVGQLDAARRLNGADELRLATYETARASLVAQERYGHLRQLREALAAATRASNEAQQHRDRAAKLRADEAVLRARVRPSIPSSEAISSLRALRESLRIAEAQVAVGLSITVRPSRTLALRSGQDGAPATTTTIGEPLTIAAKRQVALRIDDLVELEISAGEETARAKASALRERWEAEGARVLREHHLDTVEDLDKLRAESDAILRTADSHRRDAEVADQLAAQLAAGIVGASEVTARIAELERDLGAVDSKVLDVALGQLGPNWATALKKAIVSSDEERQGVEARIAAAHQKFTRLEAQTEGQAKAAEDARIVASRLQTAFPEMDATAKHATAELAQIDRDLAEIEQGLASVVTAATDEESKARGALAAATKVLERAEKALSDRTGQASEARDLVVQATTRLEGVRSQAVGFDVDTVWTAALAAGSTLAVEHWSIVSTNAEQQQLDARARTVTIAKQLVELAAARATTIKSARDTVEAAEAAARAARTTADELASTSQSTKDECNQQRIALGDMKTQAAGVNLDGARQEITRLQTLLVALPATDSIETADLEYQRWTVERVEGQLREAEKDLAEARGALQQVGGAIVRERQQEISHAIEQARAREREIAVEYNAWKLLVDTLRETESAEGTNLGKQLAVPVSERFRELTGGRYGKLEMGAHLESNGINVAGEVRDISALSAGTQDQLATLLRICVAEQIGSSIVLDDQLSQSDADRVGWFNAVLRNAAKKIQIVMITCRPSEVLSTVEMPAGTDPVKVVAAGLLHAIDLSRVIRRFGSHSSGAT